MSDSQDPVLLKLYQKKDNIEKRICDRKRKLRDSRAIEVDWPTIKKLIRNWNNWFSYNYDGSDQDGYSICTECTDDDECYSSVCAIPANLMAFQAFMPWKGFCDVESLIRCQCCIDNCGNDYIDELLEEYETEIEKDELFEIDPDWICQIDRAMLLKKTKV